MRTNWRRKAVVLPALGAMLLATVILATAIGSVSLPLGEVLRALASRLTGAASGGSADTIIWQIRIPRVLTAILVGGALGTAGAVFQGLLRNPMADPYIIGTSGGAALGATIALMLPIQVSIFGFTFVSVAAFVGALGAVLLVYNIARVGPRTPVTTLLLTGFALSSILAAIMSFLMFISNNALRRIILWTMGGLSGADWTQLSVVIPAIVIALVAVYTLAPDLNAFLLGDEQAASLGVNVERRKLLLLGLGSWMTAAAVSVSGLVGFVGLVVPHVVRLVLGPDHRLLLPASTLVGGIFLVIADLAARSLMPPAELPVGIITALVGGPFFIYLLRKSRREYSF
jgi:iron complex transport system permease protein